MGKRVVDDNSLIALADALREQTGEQSELIFPEDFAGAVHAIHGAAYAEGHTDGKAEGEEACTARHFVHTFVGDGSTAVTVHVPFEPDKLVLFNLNPLVQTRANELAIFVVDLSAFGRYAGLATVGSGTAINSAVYSTNSYLTRYSRQADGMVTIQNVGISATTAGVFTAGETFVLVAVKHIGQTDKERITAFVERLTGSGTVTLNQARVNGAFTDDEWATLIGTKPDWTFVFI